MKRKRTCKASGISKRKRNVEEKANYEMSRKEGEKGAILKEPKGREEQKIKKYQPYSVESIEI